MDSLDRQLVHALFVDGRAPFSRIAEVLGVSDQTVARRYQRLSEAGAMHVLGRLDAGRLGQVDWMVRLQCAPRASLAIAEALARREDTHWVRLASGGTEVVCTVQAANEQARDALLLEKLPATRSITAISAHCLLHLYRGGQTRWPGVTSALTSAQAAELGSATELGPRAETPPAEPEPMDLDESDRALVDELTRDGRATFATLAAATGRHEAAVRRRLARLCQTGALYFDVDIDNRLLGYHSSALLWIRVEPSRLVAVGQALASHPEIAFAAATTGPSNLLASVIAVDGHALYLYLAERLGSLPGIVEIETAPIQRTVKRAGTGVLPGP
ncbi:MAG TPA: Lrp/AsnC family transcriptional regulator [Actinocrinis sp.]|nr:Lrp/AsnC family transcriptional regulator [Actinocrinis sp.]